MPLAGPRLFDGEAIVPGVVDLDERGRVVEVLEGEDAAAVDHRGLVVPSPVNAHTHIADRLARGKVETTSIQQAVAPPDGAKHTFLRQADDQALVDSMRGALEEAQAVGTRRVLDFREQGPRGASLARKAAEDVDIELVLFGRPSSPEAWRDEVASLAPLVDGIGISGLADQPLRISEDQAAWCHGLSKRVALHLSEGQREDAEAALSLEPDLLVHGTFLSKGDIQAVAEAGVPLVLCPRSNALFGNAPPVQQLVEAGARLGLGSDNAMFHPVDVWQEAAFLAERADGLAPIHLLRMACGFHLEGEPAPSLAPGTPVCVLDDAKGLRPGLAHARVAVPRGRS